TAAVVGCGALAGCKTPPAADLRPLVSHATQSRFGAAAGPGAGPVVVPEEVGHGGPVTEDQAVVLALWNNALFREQLVELDLTRADLVQAGLLPNPELIYFWPVSGKAFKFAIEFPLEAVYLRPLRVKAAAQENERAAGRLTQLALDLIRDTRQAHSDLLLAHDRVQVAERAVRLRERILELAETRQKAGDASALEVSTARIDALQARQDLVRLTYEIRVAEERLLNLTGLSNTAVLFRPDETSVDPRLPAELDALVADAVENRPDAVAAAHAARAAAERVRLARLGWVRFLGVMDATSGKLTGHELGPALRLTLPIFNRNQGGIGRAEAENEQLRLRQQTVQNQIILDVRTAHARVEQARAERDALRARTR
ncbi:MAG: TolC family protein, partial [Gemmataceae bacterium]|nr:TolC family protein [Gemmataceae bacterium]